MPKIDISFTHPKTNSSHLKMSFPKRKVVFQSSIFRCDLLVSGRVNELISIPFLQYISGGSWLTSHAWMFHGNFHFKDSGADAGVALGKHLAKIRT